MEQKIMCIICPIGCQITVSGEKNKIVSVEGYTCKRGLEYAQNEFNLPVRIITSTVRVDGGRLPLVSVRSNKAIPKELLMDCMEIIKGTRIKAPILRYQVIIPNILHTGIDIVATDQVPLFV